MNEIRVDSRAVLQEHLFADSWNEDLGRHRSNCALRGRSTRTTDLATSLLRLGGVLFPELEGLTQWVTRYAAPPAHPKAHLGTRAKQGSLTTPTQPSGYSEKTHVSVADVCKRSRARRVPKALKYPAVRAALRPGASAASP